MKKLELKINNIPAILWGEKSTAVFIAVHGNMSHKADEVISILAEEATAKGYQVLSFDLPEHGERKDEDRICNVQNAVADLEAIMQYVKEQYQEISLWACSMGAYFSLLAYQQYHVKQTLFLSPVIDMQQVIENMMYYANIKEEQLKQDKIILLDFGPTLYWDYYCYVKEHPIQTWNTNLSILYGKKDTIENKETVEDYCLQSHGDLTIMENGEHFFHTQEQLQYYKNWLKQNLITKNEDKKV